MDLGLADKVVCVAGSTRGIGRGVAEAFLKEGARVVVTGREAETLCRVGEEMQASWGVDHVLLIEGDLTQTCHAQQCMEKIQRQWGGMDILVANVGSGRGQSGWSVDSQEWTRLLNLNLVGSALLTNAAVPLLEERPGASIVFISSLAGVEALSAPLPYTAAKAGVIALAKTLSRLLASRGIRVNTVAPGNIFFEQGVWHRKLQDDADAVASYLAAEVPLNRLGTVQEVADSVMFLSSTHASFITGACLLVDGGQSRSW